MRIHSNLVFGLTLLAIVLSEGKFCSSDGFWPQTEVYNEVSMNCDSGSMRRKCMGDMEWGMIRDNDCQCVPNEEVPVLQNVKRGETHKHQCDRGYIDVTCNNTGTWDMNDIIADDCYCLKNDGFSMTETENYGSKKCTLGEAERFCNFGKWNNADYGNCFNYKHQCKTSTYKTVDFFISPSTGHSNVEVCVLPVLRTSSAQYTVDQIKSLGQCTKTVNTNLQFHISFELDPDLYLALIYAHSDHSFVSIPALNPLLVGDHYEFLFSMQSCDNTLSFISSDSFSISLFNSYVWAQNTNPRVTLYYTDNLSLKLKDIAQFKKKVYQGVHGLGEHQFKITNLQPFTKYQFYVFVELFESDSSSIRPLVSNRVLGHTFNTCHDSMWDEVGVDTESHIKCTEGYHSYFCAKASNYQAVFSTRRDPCYCKEETVHGVVYPKTQYNHSVSGPTGIRRCGWMGIWEDIPSIDCAADGEWEAIYDGGVVSKKCENGGQLTRKCSYGKWESVVDMNCKCPLQLLNEITWYAANREETSVHMCGIGSVTRSCSWYGYWQNATNVNCRCVIDLPWTEQPHNTTQEIGCGVDDTEGNVSSRRCGYDGFWDIVDHSRCMCDGIEEEEIKWESTVSDTAAWINCEVGSKARICLPRGLWDDVIADYDCACADDGEWIQTIAGETSFLPCPDNKFKSQSRRCQLNGIWSDVNSIGCYGSCPAFGRFPVTLSGTISSVSCEEGGGSIVMNCLRKIDANDEFYGEWDFDSWRVDGDCKCKGVDEFASSNVNMVSEVQCDLGKRTKMCGKYTARWEKPMNNECMCSVIDSPMIIPPTPVFDRSQVPCSIGTRDVLCGKLGHYENENDLNCYCNDDNGFDQTHAGETAKSSCLEKGDRSRVCPSSGFWQSIDYSQCQCRGLNLVTDSMSPDSFYQQDCPVGQYDVSCSQQGATDIIENTCACSAMNGFPETIANTYYNVTCGNSRKTAYCSIDGEWMHVINPCFCPATTEFPEAWYGETVEAMYPQCYKGYCNETTGMTEYDYSGCKCSAIDDWPDMYHTETITRVCSTMGTRTATCLYGLTSISYIDCQCISTDGDSIDIGEYQSFPCMMGFILKQCRGDDYWYSVTDSYCGCASSESGLSMFELVPAGVMKTVDCGAGSMKILCDSTGHYDMTSWENTCRCPAEMIWPETPAKDEVTIDCATSGQTTGRTCGEYGIWSSVVSSCMCPDDGEWLAATSGQHMQVCTSGATIRRTCNDDGTWGTATGSCLDHSCPEDGVFPMTAHLGSYSHTCGNGFMIKRTCESGLWSGVDWSHCGCADEDGFISGEFIDEDIFSTFSSLPCGEGERLRECRYGVWQAINYSNCFCPAVDVMGRTQALKAYLRDCPAGKIHSNCLHDGTWEIVNDTCGCAADSTAVEGILFPSLPHGQHTRVQCLAGYMERRCSPSAEWETVDYRQCRCVADGWSDALPTEAGRHDCQEGYLTRMCKPNGQWGSINSDSCACSITDLFPRTVVSTNVTHLCGIGSVSATCSLYGWINEIDHDCKCVAEPPYNETARNSFDTVACGDLAIGVKTRKCLNSGRWEGEEDKSQCIQYCMAIGDWGYTQPNTTATLSCPEGYFDGSITRFCNENGLWEAGVSTCKPMRCPAMGAFPITPINGVATINCDEGQIGTMRRRCELKDNIATWGELEDTCEDVFCMIGDSSYGHNEEITQVCNEGQIGEKVMKCITGDWNEISSTCESLHCNADIIQGIPEGVFGDLYHMNCGIDYTGSIIMKCNAFQQWIHQSGSCNAIEPIIHCIPTDNSLNISLSSITNDIYTIYCTSNIRIKQIINDDLSNMNIHIIFETLSTTLSYPTTSLMLSEYTVVFIFKGSFPPLCNGDLYVLSNSFISMTNISYPSSTIIQSFTTRDGKPLPPHPIQEHKIRILSIDYYHRTVSLQFDLLFDSLFFDENEIIFIGSNLHNIRSSSSSVIIHDAIINNIIPITWRVRKGEYWSEYTELIVYRPLVLLPPSQPIIQQFSSTIVIWSWKESEIFGQSFENYSWILICDDQFHSEGEVKTNSLQLQLIAGKTYTLRVAVCSKECSIFSADSLPITLSSSVFTPTAPRNPSHISHTSSSARLSWEAPAVTGGAVISKYIIRISSQQNMRVIDATYETMTLSYDLMNIKTRVFIEIAAFNGYLSPFLKYSILPNSFETVWNTNNDDNLMYDNTIILSAHFNYLASAECTITDTMHSSFIRIVSIRPTTLVHEVIQPLAAETQYSFHCEVKEIGAIGILSSDFIASTAATADILPSVVVSAKPTSSLTATVSVSTNLIGRLACYMAQHHGVSTRPQSLSMFAGNWVQEQTVLTTEHPVEFIFTVDVDGDLLDSNVIYHAWCVVRRDVVRFDGENPVITTVAFPEYRPVGSSRRILQAVLFEVDSVNPTEFMIDVDPSSDLVLHFTKSVMVGEGSVTLLSEKNELLTVAKEDIVCLQTVCTLRLKGGLRPQQAYVLNVAVDAFVSGGSPLETGVSEHFFQTGLQRCDSKYVSKGLSNTKVCECFSVDSRCECECGETSVMRTL